jgi:hypothetical protein
MISMTEELNLRRVNIKRVPHTLTASQKLERVKISGKRFGQFNKFQVKDLARVVTGDEIWVSFENSKFAIWVDADARHLIRPKQFIGAKNAMLWVCFNPIGTLDSVLLRQGETSDQSFSVHIVLDSLGKKLS